MLKFENKENGRFYYIQSQSDLINDHVITITRGGANISVVRHMGFESHETLAKEIQRLTKKRLKRGYVLVN